MNFESQILPNFGIDSSMNLWVEKRVNIDNGCCFLRFFFFLFIYYDFLDTLKLQNKSITEKNMHGFF